MEFAWKKYLAEFFGTGLLVLFACGAAVMLGGTAGIVGIALTFGLVLMVLIYLIGGVSGCHVNPAVSLAMVLNKRMSWGDFFMYIVAQFLGAAVGALALYGIFSLCGGSSVWLANMGVNGYDAASASQIDMWGAVIVELILTFVFVVTIMSVTKDKAKANIAPIVIGLCLVLVHLVGISLTGTSVNPARSLGAAVAALIGGNSLAIEQVWVFIAAPFVGGLLAGLVYMLFNRERGKVVKVPAISIYQKSDISDSKASGNQKEKEVDKPKMAKR